MNLAVQQRPSPRAAPKGNEIERIRRMRAALIMSKPFFGLLASRLKIVRAEWLSTMATDGKHLFYSPAYVAGMDDLHLMGLIAHEVMHIVCEHTWRRGSRDHEGFNFAADYAIDPVLLKAGFKVPDALVNPDWIGWNAERIYEEIVRQQRQQPSQGSGEGQPQPNGTPQPGQGDPGNGQPQQGNAPQQGKGDPKSGAGSDQQSGGASQPKPEHAPYANMPSKGIVMDAPKETELQDRLEWKQAITTAAQKAKLHGSMPAELALLVEDAIEAKADWRAILRRFVQMVASSDYSWSRPSMRYMTLGMYLPALRSEQIPPIVIAWDTSGSMMGTEDQKRVMSEASSIIEESNPREAHVVYFDARIQGHQEFKPYDPLDYKPTGGGGTSFRPIFEWVREQDIDPACLIVVTDMYGTHEQEDPGYPVMWASTTKHVPDHYLPPFGEMVYLDFE